MVLTTSLISGASAKDVEIQLHPPRLDLGEVEDVVDQGEQMPARAEHAVERFEVLLSASASSRSISLTPMMALSGVRSSWLILARNCDLCWLASASCRLLSSISLNSCALLDRQYRLRGEGLQEFDRVFREFPGALPANHQGADDLIGGEQRNHQASAITKLHEQLVCAARTAPGGNLIGLPPLRDERESFGKVGVVLGYDGNHVCGHSVGRAQLELAVGIRRTHRSHQLRCRKAASPWRQWCRARFAGRASS